MSDPCWTSIAMGNACDALKQKRPMSPGQREDGISIPAATLAGSTSK
ncbi:MAG: hypothetical protein ACLVJ6_09180 [Merdibacter sp.]